MNRKFKKIIGIMLIAVLAIGLLAGCGTSKKASTEVTQESQQAAAETVVTEEDSTDGTSSSDASSNEASNQESSPEVATAQTSSDFDAVITTASALSGGALDGSSIFTERDLTQNVDLSQATSYTLADGEQITLDKEGIYVFTGSASNASIIVDADSQDKVQIVLDGVEITNESIPAIYVKSADKVFVTTTESDNTLVVSGAFQADGDTNTDAVIYSKDDLVLNGLGTLTIESSNNGVTSKDDLKITGGTINVAASADAFEANDSVAVADGDITILSGKDAIHAEYDEDDTVGYVYICGGNLSIQASDDGIQGTTIVQIDGGTIDISAAEGIEATWVQLNDGNISIYASDDGINASYKSTACDIMLEVNGGEIAVEMGQGDTDALDSNGVLIVNGGTLNLNAMSPFDYDEYAEYNGGTIIVNGQEVNSITSQMMGGGMGGPGGGMGGPGQQGGHQPGGWGRP